MKRAVKSAFAYMTNEVVFFQSGNISVTNARFIVGAQTFAMRGITSVEGVEMSANYTGVVILALFGIIIIFVGLGNSSIGLGIIGILLVIASIWLGFRRKPMFTVVLRTAGGEVTAYQSQDRDHIHKLSKLLTMRLFRTANLM